MYQMLIVINITPSQSQKNCRHYLSGSALTTKLSGCGESLCFHCIDSICSLGHNDVTTFRHQARFENESSLGLLET